LLVLKNYLVSGSFFFFSDYPIGTIGINDVKTYLLKTAHREVETIKNNFMLKIFGAEQNQQNCCYNVAKVEPSTIIHQFLDPTMLRIICTQINKHIIGEFGQPFSTFEVMSFIKVQLYLSFYSCSPAAFFPKKTRTLTQIQE
jgi:hypothetical protein